MKYLVALIVIVGLLAWLRSKRRPPTAGQASGKPSSDAAAPKAAAPGAVNMLRCAFCGVHVPGDEALHQEALAFCSDDHRRRHASAPDV